MQLKFFLLVYIYVFNVYVDFEKNLKFFPIVQKKCLVLKKLTRKVLHIHKLYKGHLY